MNPPMPIPLLDLKAQWQPLKSDITAAIEPVMESQYLIGGPEVQAFENEIASYCQTTHAVGCASGSDAILLALAALDVQPGDGVICPAYTFFATAGYPARLGATVKFCDIDPGTYNLDPTAVESCLSSSENIKAILPVHLYGQCADMDRLLEIARQANVPLVEDAAQAIGAEDAQGRRAGGIGDIGCLSFYPTKNLGGFGDGGMVTTSREGLAEKLRVLRNHGDSGNPKYRHELIGFNSRLDALQAAVLRVKLKHLDGWTHARQRNAKLYGGRFASAGAQTSAVPLAEGGFPLRTPHAAQPAGRHVYNQYIIRVPADLRPGLRACLSEKKIGNEIYYPIPLHLQPCFKHLGYKEGDFPQAEAAAKETLAIPVYPELEERQVEYVADTIIEFLKNGV